MPAILLQGLSSAQLLAPMLMAAGAIGMAMIAMRALRQRAARRGPRGSPRDALELLRSRREQPRIEDARPAHASAQAEAQAAAMVDLARRLAAQLDNKAQRLETLMRQADERLARLGGGGGGVAASGPGAAARAARKEAATPMDPVTRAVYELADQGCSAVEIAQTLDEQIGKVELILALRAA